MTTSQRKSILSDVLGTGPIPRRTLVYFRARLCNRIHALVLEEFSRLEKRGEINRAQLGRRIDKAPEQITRWLGSAGNWTIETVSDLMLGMGSEPSLAVSSLKQSVKAIESERAELPNAPFPKYEAGMPAANDEPLKYKFDAFSNPASPGSSAQKQISQSA